MNDKVTELLQSMRAELKEYLASWAGERAEYYGEALKAGSAESIIRVTRVLLGALGAAE